MALWARACLVAWLGFLLFISPFVVAVVDGGEWRDEREGQIKIVKNRGEYEEIVTRSLR